MYSETGARRMAAAEKLVKAVVVLKDKSIRVRKKKEVTCSSVKRPDFCHDTLSAKSIVTIDISFKNIVFCENFQR
jgi:hypothetical protein